MEKLSGLWLELQKNNKLPGGGLTSSCQEELLELMRQLDIMLTAKRRDWEHETAAIRSQLEMKDKELNIQTTTLEHKNRQFEDMRTQLTQASRTRDEVVQQYEAQVVQLSTEVQRMKREYEKLQKKHSRHTKEAHRLKAETTTEIEGGRTEMKRLREKMEDYHARLQDSEQQRKMLKKQLDTVEAQKRALAEKCEFVQQQSQTYQSQIDRRRQLQDNTELNLKTTITQLEGQAERQADTVTTQEEKIRKLKASLSEAMNAHKRAMNDNERLLDDLKKANTSIRRVEGEKQQMELEVQSRDDLLRAANEDAHQYSHDVSILEQSLSAKDDIIKNLGDSARQEEAEQVVLLRHSLNEAKEESRSHKRAQKKLRDEVTVLESKLENSVKLRDSIAHKLDEKDSELIHLKSTELHTLQAQVQQLQDKFSVVEASHGAELDGMRTKLAQLTTDLHQRNASIANFTDKMSRLEQQVVMERDMLEGREAELKVAQAHIEALRVENLHLRQDFMEKLGTVCGSLDAEQQLQSVSSEYTAVVARLERENQSLQEDVSRLKQEMSVMETSFQETAHSRSLPSGRDNSKHKPSKHKQSVQGYLDSTAQGYESQIRLLQAQKHRLEEELDLERRENRRMSRSHFQSELNGSAGTILDSEPMSLIHTLNDLDSPAESLECDLESSADAAAELFLSQEQERAKELERLIDSHISELRAGTELTLRKYTHK
ncbi:centrosomal protein of 63 kDa-like [Haliotis rufescens]|uniref:centrosomal protein of 63 kDa-like n=1 Tax=Haliotis rufescens TaxID=6454 RepID=UPI00201F7271|nr:centrosomal protein of 63 kDa-like [Haliotis rufescens]XP_048246189.1 centrosomal protein of 63 kDa-like [Haliotis rufescens]XP_048246190.1 centrosomal protein of 63 kDa-like [Haliotis rufescens]XP_048246191.1 centrosomal protein of 63 kDa-like [Haliotis rufescens]